jgi:hypothetical protein
MKAFQQFKQFDDQKRGGPSKKKEEEGPAKDRPTLGKDNGATAPRPARAAPAKEPDKVGRGVGALWRVEVGDARQQTNIVTCGTHSSPLLSTVRLPSTPPPQDFRRREDPPGDAAGGRPRRDAPVSIADPLAEDLRQRAIQTATALLKR